MNNLSNNEKNLLYLLALVLTLTVCIRFVLIPTAGKYQAAKVNLEQKRQTRSEIQDKLNRIQGIDGEIEEMLLKASQLSEPFFLDKESEYYHKWIVEMAERNQVHISSLAIGDPTFEQVEPYKVEKTEDQEAYLIEDYYNNMIDVAEENTEVGIVEEEPTVEESTSGVVIHRRLQLGVKATKGELINLMDQLSKLNKHVIVESVAIEPFNEDQKQEYNLDLKLYSIHKKDDGLFDYTF